MDKKLLKEKVAKIKTALISSKMWTYIGRLNNPILRQKIMEKWDIISKSNMRNNILKQTYFPFIGWILTMAYLNDDENARYHSKQALVLAVFFASVLTVLSFFLVSLSLNDRIARLIFTILIYLLEVVYFSLCITGTVLIVKNKKITVPVLDKYTGYINI
ncbi:MAG: hypothetical protein CVV44_17300 [Spirochaetae bacterium HGW-Spirochaetae-1]|nr:MAG: hypothetical protein CVV44_17300 [Spirochaetae bacterium HGW-Spirochaetae-1]